MILQEATIILSPPSFREQIPNQLMAVGALSHVLFLILVLASSTVLVSALHRRLGERLVLQVAQSAVAPGNLAQVTRLVAREDRAPQKPARG